MFSNIVIHAIAVLERGLKLRNTQVKALLGCHMNSFNTSVNSYMGHVSSHLHSPFMETDKQWKTKHLLVSMQCFMFSQL